MKAHWCALLLLVPAIAEAQPPETPDAPSRWEQPELLFGAALIATGYGGSIWWAQDNEGDQDALYVPVLGPWLELLTLPDCPGDHVFCEHGNATRGVLLLTGAAQLVGVGLTAHALFGEREEKRVVVSPMTSSTTAGVAVGGRF